MIYEENFPLFKFREYFKKIFEKFNKNKPSSLDICGIGFNDDEIKLFKIYNWIRFYSLKCYT